MILFWFEQDVLYKMLIDYKKLYIDENYWLSIWDYIMNPWEMIGSNNIQDQ